MRRWIALAGRLYPRSWRERYGEEFDALLEDAPADCRQLLNVTRGAMAMQLTSGISYVKAAGVLALAGAVLAGAASYAVTPRYVSSAVVRLTPVTAGTQSVSKDALQQLTEDRIEELKGWSVLLPNLLAAAQKFDLYPEERKQGRAEDAAKRFQQDLQIRPVMGYGRSVADVEVSFAYPDADKARAVVGAMVADIEHSNGRLNRNNAEAWEYKWSVLKVPHGPFPFSTRFDVEQPANVASTWLKRGQFAAWGLGAGLVLGLLAVLFLRHPVAGLGLVACALAGCGVGAALSLRITEQHTATVLLRLRAPSDPKRLAGESGGSTLSALAPRLRQTSLASNVFWTRMSRSSFRRADVAEVDRRFGLRVLNPTWTKGSGSNLEVSFRDPDAKKARDVAGLLAFVVNWEQLEEMEKQVGAASGREQAYLRASLLSAAGMLSSGTNWDFQETMVTHHRLETTVAGAVAGLLLGLALWRSAERRHRGGLTPPELSAA